MKDIKVVELFAGVGGFRLALERANKRFHTVMANQWEPGKKIQNASECYALNFKMTTSDGICYQDHNNNVLWAKDVAELADAMENGGTDGLLAVPEHDLLVGGFPCFLEDTSIITNAGKKPIQDVEIGDVVLTHMSRYRKVTKTFKNPLGERKIICVSLGNGQEVFCTEEHPFWAILKTEGFPEWVPAIKLKPNNMVLTMGEEHYTNEWIPVAEIIPTDIAPEFVYNIEVTEDNSYTADGVAVHNCQDYSVARPNNQSHGLQGKKGVLWWSIHRILKERRPENVLLENVDRLLKSPSKQRGRDFAIILATLSDLGYTVEWQVINAADYGFPQRRRRIFILARQDVTAPLEQLFGTGVITRAFPITGDDLKTGKIDGTPWEISENFNTTEKMSPFENRGVLRNREYITGKIKADYSGKRTVLADILEPAGDVSENFETDPARWAYTKGSKDEERVHPSGFKYRYKEGPVPFPDPLDKPARTILTGEGGASPNRTTHCIEQTPGTFRRLTPRELERINGFPDDWTLHRTADKELSSGQRGFLMGNALVVGVVQRIAAELEKEI